MKTDCFDNRCLSTRLLFNNTVPAVFSITFGIELVAETSLVHYYTTHHDNRRIINNYTSGYVKSTFMRMPMSCFKKLNITLYRSLCLWSVFCTYCDSSGNPSFTRGNFLVLRFSGKVNLFCVPKLRYNYYHCTMCCYEIESMTAIAICTARPTSR